MTDSTSRQQNSDGEKNRRSKTQVAPHKNIFLRFLSYYTGQRHLFFMDMVCALVIAGTELAFPQILRQLAGGLFTEGKDAIVGSLALVAVGLIGMYALHFFCRVFVISWGHIMGARMESHMREDLFDAYERMSFSYYDRHKTGDLMSRLVSDLFDISETAHHGPEYLVIGVMEIAGSFVILSFINVPLTLVMVAIAVALVVFNFFANVHMRAIFRENRVRISNVNTQLEDSLAGIRVVKGFVAEDHERAKFRKSNDAYLDSKARMYFAMGRYHGAIDSMMGILNTTIVVFGGWMIAHEQMRAVDLATFALYVSLFTTPISNILNFTETFQKGLAGFQRFTEIVDTRPDVEDKPNAPDLAVFAGEIIYEDVHFSYDGDDEVIRGLNLHIEPGKTVALVGPSGGGKSTTCSLLPRFYDVTSGSITIDGQDVRDVTQHSLRDAIGLVQQDVYLFDGTIAENIAYGCPEATREEIEAAARRANIAAFAESLPDGYDTEVGQRGTRLSGGQKQRISIARVFLKNPPLLILDEATSALDNESERAVQESLSELAKNRTTLIIAHRLSTIMGADEIITIEGGRAVERGTHEELLAKGGTYATYYRMQFGAGAEAGSVVRAR
ncbi:ABC transporter ATP-binding protein [Lancefieldella sp. Marseille-Q7238]|uniref:ABC transporter ATP-binding protein n=1 Tax=Lancefieldella sp. Marseille-Q7238 TaxID=3022127 RepID=UPI0024A87669|nr:ABC transporter ATP-binding protein [Lancefieldella sp. Marseille-Q7238]